MLNNHNIINNTLYNMTDSNLMNNVSSNIINNIRINIGGDISINKDGNDSFNNINYGLNSRVDSINNSRSLLAEPPCAYSIIPDFNCTRIKNSMSKYGHPATVTLSVCSIVLNLIVLFVLHNAMKTR